MGCGIAYSVVCCVGVVGVVGAVEVANMIGPVGVFGGVSSLLCSMDVVVKHEVSIFKTGRCDMVIFIA